MSKYTTEVRFICESSAGLLESEGANNVENILTTSAPLIFNFSFPIFDESYRLELEKKILRHYYTREIAFESVGLWKLKLQTRLNEVMPLFNQKYNSTLLSFNPLFDTDVTTESKRDVEGSSNTDTTNNHSISFESEYGNDGTTGNKNLYSDTPQGSVQNLQAETYLTNATFNDGRTHDAGEYESSESRSSDGNEQNTTTSTDSYVERIVGKRNGESYSKLINDFRKTFLNVDMEVIESLSDLFFTLW